MEPQTRQCQNCKKDFVIEPEDFNFYEKMKVPAPTSCFDCRLQKKMSFRNERSLYKDVCDLCGKQMISMYSPDKPFKVYCKECWYSDDWDPFKYGREYNWDKSFFMQFRELMEAVPRISVMHIHNNINCDYANYVADSKNVYLSQSIIENSENVYYSRNVDKSKDIFDCFNIKESEQSCENVDSARNYKCKFVYRSRDCIDASFLFDCVNCQNCFMSSNLRNRQFVIRNKQYTKQEYAEELEKNSLGTERQLLLFKKEFDILMKKSLHKFANLLRTINCTGNNIDASKNTRDSFDVYNCENVKFCNRVVGQKNSYDVMGAKDGELGYEAIGAGYGIYNLAFTSHSDGSTHSRFIDWCQNSNNLFACFALRKKQYCILNKQYTKDEYEKLVLRIIEHIDRIPYTDKRGRTYKYGEFAPIELSPFAYNETIAQEYFPLTKETAFEQGYAWRDPDPSPYKPTITSEKLPDDITSVTDAIVNEIISCAVCKKPYRIIKQELDFLKQHLISLPRMCPECRHKARFDLRNPLKLWHRKCMKEGCPNEFETSYAPDRKEIIYCESCYNAEVA